MRLGTGGRVAASPLQVLCVVKGWLSGSVVYGGVGFTSGGISPFAKASYGPGFMFMPLRVRFGVFSSSLFFFFSRLSIKVKNRDKEDWVRFSDPDQCFW